MSAITYNGKQILFSRTQNEGYRWIFIDQSNGSIFQLERDCDNSDDLLRTPNLFIRYLDHNLYLYRCICSKRRDCYGRPIVELFGYAVSTPSRFSAKKIALALAPAVFFLQPENLTGYAQAINEENENLQCERRLSPASPTKFSRIAEEFFIRKQIDRSASFGKLKDVVFYLSPEEKPKLAKLKRL